MNTNVIIATVFNNLLKKGYVLTPSILTNAKQVIFDVTHPKWHKDHATELNQQLAIYDSTISTGHQNCMQGIDIFTKEKFHFGLGNNEQLHKDAIRKLPY